MSISLTNREWRALKHVGAMGLEGDAALRRYKSGGLVWWRLQKKAMIVSTRQGIDLTPAGLKRVMHGRHVST